MNIEEKNHIEANKLIDYYYPYYYKKYPRTKKMVATKYANHFYKAAEMFSIRDNYDAEKLIQSFMLDGFKFPMALPFESTWKRYVNYYVGLKDKEPPEVELVKKIVNAAKVLKDYETVQNWLDKKSNQLALQTNNVNFDLTLFSFSFSFEFYVLENAIDSINIHSLRNNVLLLPNYTIKIKLFNKISNLLGSDMIVSNKKKNEIIF